MGRDDSKFFDQRLQEALTRCEAAQQQKETTMFASEGEFRSWLTAQDALRQKKRHRMLKGGLAAAVFVCLLLALAGLFSPSDPGAKPLSALYPLLPDSLASFLTAGESIASPNSDGAITEENGSIVIGGDGNGNVGTWTATFTSYDDVPEKYQSQLIWFEEMPEGYELETIEIMRNYNGTDIYYTYVRGIDEILVEQLLNTNNENKAAVLNQYDYLCNVSGREIYVKDSKYSRRYVYADGEDIISIIDYGKCENKKIEAMIASAKTGWNRM